MNRRSFLAGAASLFAPVPVPAHALVAQAARECTYATYARVPVLRRDAHVFEGRLLSVRVAGIELNVDPVVGVTVQ